MRSLSAERAHCHNESWRGYCGQRAEHSCGYRTPEAEGVEYGVWRIISTKSANDKIAKCTCGNAHSASSHNLYGTHENSIPCDFGTLFFRKSSDLTPLPSRKPTSSG